MVDRVIVSALALVALSGCAMLSPGGSKTAAATENVDMSDYFAQRLAEGRLHLAGNRPTRAIEAFRQASYDARYSPDAFNGMAVAYTQLGRDDVAERLFERAIEADPSDPRFTRNLARLNARQMPGSGSPVRTADTGETSQPGSASELATPATTRLVSASGGKLKPFDGGVMVRSKQAVPEQMIRTAPTNVEIREPVRGATPAPVQPEVKRTIIRTGVAVSGQAARSIGNITVQPSGVFGTVAVTGSQAGESAGYPIRVRLDQEGKPAASKPAPKRIAAASGKRGGPAKYPIRVRLSPSN